MRDWLFSVRVERGGSNREHRAPCVCLLVCHAVLLVVGCEPLSQSCTSADCDIPFGVQFNKSSAWATGVYRVEVHSDGAKVACEVQLPFASCGIEPSCDGPKTWRLGLSGCALPFDDHALFGVTFAAWPTDVKISVFHDGRAIGSSGFTPRYSWSYPNGRKCGPECRSAPVASLNVE